MHPSDFEIGTSYLITKIEECVESEDLYLNEYGPEIVGENFLVIKSFDYDKTVSFILDGTSGDKFTYKCIYKFW